MIASHLSDYVSSNGLKNAKGFAYELGNLTNTALLLIKNDLHPALARGEPTAVVLFDQSAAFDMIDHGILLDCLSSYFGVGCVVLDWFKPTSLFFHSVSRLALLYLMQKSFSLA